MEISEVILSEEGGIELMPVFTFKPREAMGGSWLAATSQSSPDDQPSWNLKLRVRWSFCVESNRHR